MNWCECARLTLTRGGVKGVGSTSRPWYGMVKAAPHVVRTLPLARRPLFSLDDTGIAARPTVACGHATRRCAPRDPSRDAHAAHSGPAATVVTAVIAVPAVLAATNVTIVTAVTAATRAPPQLRPTSSASLLTSRFLRLASLPSLRSSRV